MNGDPSSDRPQGPLAHANVRLDSWKEIAAYLRRDESTVRRWEKDGLPVHRHIHKSRAAVFAYKTELDAWWRQDPAVLRNGQRADNSPPKDQEVSPHSHHRDWFKRPRSALMTATFVAALLITIFIARIVFLGSKVSSASPPVAVSPFMNMEGEFRNPSFSPDGKQVAFAWANHESPNWGIFVRPLSNAAPVRLTSTEDADDFAPVWSPDGGEIAFLRTSANNAGIYSVAALGGPVRKLIELRPDRYHTLDWSSDGEWLAYAQRSSSTAHYCIYLHSLKTGAQRQITVAVKGSYGESHFAFSPDGKSLAFVRHELAPPIFSVDVVSTTGSPAVRRLASYSEWISDVAWSSDGQSVFVAGVRQGVQRLWRLNVTTGSEAQLPELGEEAYFPAVARQGNRMAFVHEVLDSDLWRSKLPSPYGPGRAPERIISSTKVEGAPRFSPDGKRLAFLSYRSGEAEIWTSDPDGSNAAQLTNLKTAKPEMPSWSPDGRTIAFEDGGPFQVISANGGEPRRLLSTLEPFEGPSWSRDGGWIYFWRKKLGGEAQIWKVASRGGSPVQVTSNGGQSSMESPDGKYLYFTKEKARGIWKMPVTEGAEVLVVPEFKSELPGYWTVFGDGIYYLSSDANGKGEIDFFSFATRQSRRIITLSGSGDAWFGGLTVSPDRRWIVFSQRQYFSSEILFADN